MFSFDIYSRSPQEALTNAAANAVAQQGRERREAERVISYWEKKTTRLGNVAILGALDLARMRSPDWSHRFVIAVDPQPENSMLLYYGADVARLLELPGGRTPHVPINRQLRSRLPGIFATHTDRLRRDADGAPIVKQLPRRFSDVFARGCGDSHRHDAPLRLEGEITRDDGRRELYRAAFIPVTARHSPRSRLALGAFSSRIFSPATLAA